MQATSSPLQLDQYRFTNVSIEAVENADKNVAVQFHCEPVFAFNSNDRRQFRVQLKTIMGDSKERNTAYVGRIEIVGFFTVNEDWPEEKIVPLVTANAPSVLYSAVREMVVNITGRCSHGALVPQTMRFEALTAEDINFPASGATGKTR